MNVFNPHRLLVIAIGLGMSTSALAADDDLPPVPKPRPGVPASSGFTGPASGRPLPPPAPVPLEPGNVLEPGTAVEESLQLYQANEIVYTGKRAQRIADVPMTVSWIPAEELEGTGQFTLCEAIQFFPGMDCRRGPMRKSVVSAHGLGSNFLANRLLLLKDGRPLTDPWTGVFYPDETTPLTNIKQIEVIRGPGSSLYGSNAFSGVVNMITRNPEDLLNENRSYGADIRLLGGQDKTVRLQSTVAGKAGPVAALVNVYHFGSAGPELFTDPELNIVDTQEWSRVSQVSARATASVVTVDVEYTNADLGRPGGSQISNIGNCGRCHYTPNDTEHVENLNGSIQADVKATDWLRFYGEAYGLVKRRVVDVEDQITHELRPTLGKRQRLGGELRALLSVGGLNVTLGGDVKHDLVNNQNITAGLTQNDLQETIIGGFVDAQFRPFHQLALGGGLRYDYYQIPEKVWRSKSSELSPRASVMFQPIPELSFRANYGRAFRAPTFAELAINQQMYASTLLGNPELKAETLDTVEVAADVWLMEGTLKLSGTGFYKRARNFISQEFKGGSTSRFENTGDALIVGFEADAAAQVKKINSSFDVSYQFLNARSLPRSGSSEPLDYAPQHRVSLRAHSNITDMIFADLYGLYVSERQDPAHEVLPDGTEAGHIVLPSHIVASARVGVNILKGLSVSLLATNLFNTSYEETSGFPQPGIKVFTEVKFVY